MPADSTASAGCSNTKGRGSARAARQVERLEASARARRAKAKATDLELADVDDGGVDALAERLGVGARHLPQKRFFPNAEVHVLAGPGHWPFIDDPEALENIVVPFLSRQTSNA